MKQIKREFSKVRQYIGDDLQLFGVERTVLCNGKSNGVNVIHAKNGSGLHFDVLPDRALDISSFSYKGVGCSFISKTGIVSPNYYVEDEASGFLKNFFAGMITTCGLTYFGAPCFDNGQKLGLHGPISNTPAEDVCVWTEDRGVPCIRIAGKVRQAEVFREHLVLNREYTCMYGQNLLTLEDAVENKGYETQPLMLLYHMNFGYPLLTENAILTIPEKESRARDGIALKGYNERFVMQKPTIGYAEQCFFYKCRANEDNETTVLLRNPELDFAAAIKFNITQLGYLTEWKSMLAGDYALGIEPGTYYPTGRADARENQLLQYIEPGETRRFKISIEIIEGRENIAETFTMIQNL